MSERRGYGCLLAAGRLQRACLMVTALLVAGHACNKSEEPAAAPPKNDLPVAGEQSLREDSTNVPDSIARPYDEEFSKPPAALVSSGAAELPEPTPGQLVTTLTVWRGRERVDWEVTLDTSKQVLGLSIPDDIVGGEPGEGDKRFSPPLRASMADFPGSAGFVSASMLAFKAKQFDDGLYAAVELEADKGVGGFPSRPGLLADLAGKLEAMPDSAAKNRVLGLIAAASGLGGHPVKVPAAAAEVAAGLTSSFLANHLRSRPIGFYTWSPELVKVFQRDRLLQESLGPDEATTLARTLSEGDILPRYRDNLKLSARLTNGLARLDLAEAAAAFAAGKPPTLRASASLFPPSRAYETDLITRLFGQQPVPADFVLADEIIRRIRAGRLSLEPRADSGWYDHQTYALEPLVIPDKTPEAAHLDLDDAYKKELVNLFKALLALTRETHIKQVEVPTAGAAAPEPGIRVDMYPQLSQEPVATFYLRRALAYRFVHGVLTDAFGPEGLATLKRLTASGPINMGLDRELTLMESLYYGAYLNTVNELGMTSESRAEVGLGPQKSLALYRDWEPENDPDVSRDVRMMVPVFYDVGRGQVKVWVVLGVTSKPLRVHYKRPPAVKMVRDAAGRPVNVAQVEVVFKPTQFALVYPVMAELYVSRLLDRDEFRRICDRHKTQEAILAHLQ